LDRNVQSENASVEDPCQDCEILEERNQFIEEYYLQSNGLTDLDITIDTPDFLRDILHNCKNVLYRYNGQAQTYDYLSDSIENLSGYTVQEIMDGGVELLLDLVHPDDKEVLVQLQQGLLDDTIGDSGIEVEYRTQRKDGKWFWRRSHIKAVRDTDRSIIAVIGEDCDITSLKKNELKYKRLTEASLDGIIIHEYSPGQPGKVFDANQQFLDMFGYTLEETKSMDSFEIIAPQSRNLIADKIASKYEGAYEAFGMKKDGSIFPVEVRAREAQWEGKHVRIATIRDLTEQKKIQEHLEQSEHRYKNLYENALIPLFLTRISDGKLLACNRATAELFGFTDETEYKKHFSVIDSYVDPQQRKEFVETLKQSKSIQDFELQLKHKDGTPIWVSVSAEILPEKDCIEGIMRNITISKVLSNAELKILRLLMQGLINKQIARKLGRSVRTVEDHRARIMNKLGVDNIVELTQKTSKFQKYWNDE
jgi:PAS domain S-box-containing protein